MLLIFIEVCPHVETCICDVPPAAFFDGIVGRRGTVVPNYN